MYALIHVLSGQLSRILSDKLKEEFCAIRGVKQDLESLKKNLHTIDRELEAAAVKDNFHANTSLWLLRLVDSLYDIEDVLDEWEYRETQLRKSTKWGWMKLLSKVKYYRSLARRIKQISKNLEFVAKEKGSGNMEGGQTEFPWQISSQSIGSSMSNIYGRDDVLTLISETLFSNKRTAPLAIVGIAGVGKSSVAQVLYSDPRGKSHFDIKLWISVSRRFDLKRIGREFLGVVNGAVNAQSVSDTMTFEKIAECISGKKIFLVLDDVWNGQGTDWSSLHVVFQSAAPSSKILITTRSCRVAKEMDAMIFHLGLLNLQDSFKLMGDAAFKDRDPEQCERLNQVGLGIAEKAGGLPSAAVALGSLLRFKTEYEDWEQVLKTPNWDINVVVQKVFVPFLPNYLDMTLEVKRCFTFLSLFPKGSTYNSYEIINFWRSQKFVKSTAEGRQNLEMLVSLSFLQAAERDNEGKVLSYTMDNIIHDLLTCYSANEIVLQEVKDKEMVVLPSQVLKTRHLGLIGVPAGLSGSAKLRTLIVTTGQQVEDTKDDKLKHLFCPCLRSLDFRASGSSYSLFQKGLPKGCSKLIHLRRLNLSHNDSISRLPNSLCLLYNLEILLLEGCPMLKSLPNKIGNLEKLQELNTNESGIRQYPKGVKLLSLLTNLNGIYVQLDANGEHFSLEDFENLNQLSYLSMILVGERIDNNEVTKAAFDKKSSLTRLSLKVTAPLQAADILNALNLADTTSVEAVELQTGTP
ncbi:hypothetical protein SLE2022_285260 [Rubroshorea leprosula]